MVTVEQVDRWLADADRPEIDSSLRSIHAEAESEVDARRPVCLAGGHCCRFGEYGHDLFVTGLETAWFLRRATRRANDPAPAMETVSPVLRLPIATTASNPVGRGAARVADLAGSRTCPWLEGRFCGARAARPLACRTFFCDPRQDAWSASLLERLHARIRSMHDEFGIVYRYGEWLRMLSLFAAAPPTR